MEPELTLGRSLVRGSSTIIAIHSHQHMCYGYLLLYDIFDRISALLKPSLGR